MRIVKQLILSEYQGICHNYLIVFLILQMSSNFKKYIYKIENELMHKQTKMHLDVPEI